MASPEVRISKTIFLGTILNIIIILTRPFLKFGPLHPSLFSRCARSRLNSFETLDLKIFGKNSKILFSRYRCVPQIASPEARKTLSRKNDHFKVQSSSFFSSLPVLFLNSGLFILAYSLVVLARG